MSDGICATSGLLSVIWWDVCEFQDLTFRSHFLASTTSSWELHPAIAWKLHFPPFLASRVPCQLGSAAARPLCELVGKPEGGRNASTPPHPRPLCVTSTVEGLWAVHCRGPGLVAPAGTEVPSSSDGTFSVMNGPQLSAQGQSPWSSKCLGGE